MIVDSKIICKILFHPGGKGDVKEILGEIDYYQINSQENNFIVAKTHIYEDNKAIAKNSIIHKSEIKELHILAQSEVIILEKESLYLNV